MELSHSFPLPGIQCPGFEARHFWKKSPGSLVEGEGPLRVFGAAWHWERRMVGRFLGLT